MASEEHVDFDEKTKAEQINMVPIEEKEELTGSSVLIDPEAEADANALPDNGFPAGYGPNEHIKRIKTPKKPSFKERMSRSIVKMTKKQKIIAISSLVLLILTGVGVGIYLGVSGAFRVDYSDTYAAARELRTEMQKIKSSASCEKVVSYVDNAYTTAQIYDAYVEDCKEVGKGVTTDVINVLGRTEGILKDNDIFRKYEAFRLAMESASTGNANITKTLQYYIEWHNFVIAENTADSKYTWKWPDEEVKSVASILINSKEPKFVEYGEEWQKYKLEATQATNKYYALSPKESSEVWRETGEVMREKQTAFTDWEEKNSFSIKKEVPFEMVDMAVVYNKFTELYDLIRQTYQENYNYDKGGCKEMIGSILCD